MQFKEPQLSAEYDGGIPQKKVKQSTQYCIRTKVGKKYVQIGIRGRLWLSDSPLGAYKTNKQHGIQMIETEIGHPTEDFELVKVSSIPSVLYR